LPQRASSRTGAFRASAVSPPIGVRRKQPRFLPGSGWQAAMATRVPLSITGAASLWPAVAGRHSEGRPGAPWHTGAWAAAAEGWPSSGAGAAKVASANMEARIIGTFLGTIFRRPQGKPGRFALRVRLREEVLLRKKRLRAHVRQPAQGAANPRWRRNERAWQRWHARPCPITFRCAQMSRPGAEGWPQAPCPATRRNHAGPATIAMRSPRPWPAAAGPAPA